MARGDFTLFEEFALALGNESHSFAGDDIRLGLVDETAPVPTAADTTPNWSDYSGNEVDSVAGNYTADGHVLTTTTYTEAGGVGSYNADDISFAQDGSGFTNAYWGILYNADSAGAAIGFLEFDGPVSEVAGPVTITWSNAPAAIFTITV